MVSHFDPRTYKDADPARFLLYSSNGKLQGVWNHETTAFDAIADYACKAVGLDDSVEEQFDRVHIEIERLDTQVNARAFLDGEPTDHTWVITRYLVGDIKKARSLHGLVKK